MTDEVVLEHLRAIGGWVSAAEVAEALSLDERETYFALSALSRASLVMTGRGSGGATTFQAAKPGTSIPWTA